MQATELLQDQIEIGIQKLDHAPDELPAYKTTGSAGMDLCLAADDIVLNPGERVLAPTGFCIAIPHGFEGQVRMRSSVALNRGIILPNAPGTIDSDYRGELKVLVMNASQETTKIARGERFAQLIISPVSTCIWKVVSTLSESSRGAGGFGSTGTH